MNYWIFDCSYSFRGKAKENPTYVTVVLPVFPLPCQLDWELLSNPRIKGQGQRCFFLGLLKGIPVSVLLPIYLSLFTSALSPLNKSLIPKNTASSFLLSLSLSGSLYRSFLFSSPLVLFWTAAMPLLCYAHSLPHWPFTVILQWPFTCTIFSLEPSIPLTGFHILD